MARRVEATNEEQTNLVRVSVVIFLVTHYSVTYRCLPGTLMSVEICMNKSKNSEKNFLNNIMNIELVDEYLYHFN